jgi:chemotaxis protein CheD
VPIVEWYKVKRTSHHPSLPALPSGAARKRVSLGLGAVIIVDTPSIVRTILGSCVAVILHVPRLRVSAICHAQMPEREAGLCCSDTCPQPCGGKQSDSTDIRYVTCSIRYMLNDLHRRHVIKAEIICTLVGGANVIKNIDPRWSVGERNVEMAASVLKNEGIRVSYSDTGGTLGRVIEHTSDLNRTKVRYHDSPKSDADEIS